MTNRRLILITGLLVIPLFYACTGKTVLAQTELPVYKDLEFNMPVVNEPSFPGNSVIITDFGAVADGKTLNTQAIADAVNAVSGKGGGRVVIPRGIWLTGPIIMKSNVNIHAEEGALVIFSSDKDLYPLIQTSFEGSDTYRCLSPIYGKDLENIAFTGRGIFDGNGDAWRPVKKDKLTEQQWKELVRSGGVVDDDGKQWFPSEAYKKAQEMSDMNVPKDLKTIEEFKPIRDFLRPVMVSLVNCKKILIDGPVFQNSPAWCLHPLMCEDLTIRNITVRNPWYSQNGDGIDIESCRNTVLYNSNFDVGDDAICIKSGKDADGRKRAKPTENLVIKNCIVYHGHGGVTIGSEMSGGVRNMSVSDCTFMGTDVGLRFKTTRGRGGVVENLWFSDIDMINIPTQAISFNMYYGGLSVSEMLAEDKSLNAATGDVPPVTEETPLFRRISMKNITCRGAMQAIYLQGLPEMNLQDISFENISIIAQTGLACTDLTGLKIKGLNLVTEKGPAICIINSGKIEINELNLSGDSDTCVDIRGEKSKEINIKSVNVIDEKKISIGENADRSTIKIN
ncbi:MAG TPA: glycoside hydrolase family 28 protein [Bacteroidales bacterium]|nr:glycoside hydrolase family 28 protein [Bacteroidales bacterium]